MIITWIRKYISERIEHTTSELALQQTHILYLMLILSSFDI